MLYDRKPRVLAADFEMGHGKQYVFPDDLFQAASKSATPHIFIINGAGGNFPLQARAHRLMFIRQSRIPLLPETQINEIGDILRGDLSQYKVPGLVALHLNIFKEQFLKVTGHSNVDGWRSALTYEEGDNIVSPGFGALKK